MEVGTCGSFPRSIHEVRTPIQEADTYSGGDVTYSEGKATYSGGEATYSGGEVTYSAGEVTKVTEIK